MFKPGKIYKVNGGYTGWDEEDCWTARINADGRKAVIVKPGKYHRTAGEVIIILDMDPQAFVEINKKTRAHLPHWF